MSSTRRPLGEVEQEAATVAGERRDGLRLILTGRALFLFASAPHDVPHRDGTGSTSVLSFKTWTPRGGELWCEVRAPEHIALVQGLVEGAQLQIAGQLVVKPRRLGGMFVTVRVFELAQIG